MIVMRPTKVVSAQPARSVQPADIKTAIDQAVKSAGLSTGVSPLGRATEEFVTIYDDMLEMRRCAVMLAPLDFPVLILGETGTGKELVARILHGNRDSFADAYAQRIHVGNPVHVQRHKLFFPVNCSGIVDTLFESLLFGHMKGSFTGAVADELGLLRAAGKGTAFLDEIGDLPMGQQTKLLRVLQTKHVRPVGSTQEYPVHCRFVFATNKDLKAMIAKDTFREDLYYRISTFVLRTRPLRERPADIEPILRRLCLKHKFNIPTALPSVEAYASGNVRALENWLCRVSVLGEEAEVMEGL